MALIDTAFRVDELSIGDNFLITGGDANPSIVGIEAPMGSLFLTSSGKIFVKNGVQDVDWLDFPLVDAKVRVDNNDSTSGFLLDKLVSSHLSLVNLGTSLSLELSSTGVVPGTYTKIITDTYGRITSGSNPTTLLGYGITDAQYLNSNLSALANNITPGILVLTGVGTIASRLLTSTNLIVNFPNGVGANPVIDLSTSGVTAGTYGNIVVDTYGRITSINALSQSDIATALGYTPVNKAGDTMTGDLILNGDPTHPLGASTKQYVDNAITGLDFKNSVKAATTANIALSGLLTIDGIALADGDRVLVKNQTTASQNGIYTVSTGSWTRSSDADNSGVSNEVTSGLYCYVERGTVNASSGWVLSTINPITLGTTNLIFTQFSGLGQITAGNGLTQTGNTLNVVTASSSRIVVSANAIDLAVTPIGAGTYNNLTVDTYGRATAGSNIAYLTSNQNINLTGDATGSGSTNISVSLATVSAGGTFPKVTYNTKGLVIAGSNLLAADIPNLDWSKITTGVPSSLSGYGITDGITNLGGSPSIQQDTNINKPIAGIVGSLFYATDLKTWFRDNGTSWDTIQPAISGDISIPAGTTTATLANSGVVAGTYNNVIVDIKGRVTVGSNVSYLTTNQSITATGDVTGSGTTSIPLTLNTVNANIGSFGNSTNSVQLSVNEKGLITSANNVAIAFPVTSVAGKTGAVTLTKNDVGLSNIINMQQVINGGNAPMLLADPIALRPSAGTVGRLFVSSDTYTLFRDDGSVWNTIQSAISGDITINAGTTTAFLSNIGTAGTYAKVTTDAKGRVISGSNLTNSDITTALGYTPVNKAGDTMTGGLILNADPTVALGAATKQYVDNLALGLDFKNSVKAATTANITLSGNQTIDGIAVVAGDRVLVKNQTTASQNGIYVVATGSWTRAGDADNIGVTGEVTSGMFCYVERGTLGTGTAWVLSTANPIALGTTALAFTQFGGQGGVNFTVNGGLVLNSGLLSVGTASTSRIVVNASNIDLATSGITAGTYNSLTVDAYGRATAGSNVAYLTNVTLTGDITGSGTSSITTTLANSGVAPGSNYNNFTVNAKGIVTAANSVAYLTQNQAITITGDATGSGTTSIPLTLNTVPISKGGTGQTTKTAGFNALSPLTAKGDLLVHNGTSNVRLPIIADGYSLITDSSDPNGVRWQLTSVQNAGRVLQILFSPIQPLISSATMSTNNSPPLVTEGSEIWSQVINVQESTSNIRIQSSMMVAATTNSMEVGIAVFRDSTCIGVMGQTMPSNSAGSATNFTFYDSPGIAGTYTYSCRVGRTTNNGSWYINRMPGQGSLWGGLIAQNAYTIDEIFTG